ncbi:MAG: TlpA family protein disulfide reductase [Candidatus Longimicrobiales bacterium M2_2A_002]
MDSLWAEGTRHASAFVQRIADEHPDPYVRRGVLYTAMDWAGQDGRGLEALGYYDRLVAEHPGAREAEDAEWLRRRFGMPDEPAPNVPFVPLDTAAAPFYPTALGARAVLVDFWATWCVPCVEEMPTLHQAYERWADRGFEVVSVSYDDAREDVHRFRRVWPMPWRHAFEGRDAAATGEVWEAYAIGGLPHTVLIDGQGRIVALDDELKGERLEQTLRKVLSEGATPRQ